MTREREELTRLEGLEGKREEGSGKRGLRVLGARPLFPLPPSRFPGVALTSSPVVSLPSRLFPLTWGDGGAPAA